jgi:hypothetical protein
VNDISRSTIVDAVEHDPGFFLGLQFKPDELSFIRNQVCEQWLATIKEKLPGQFDQFQKNGIENYHILSHLLDHASTWGKINRVLPQVVVEVVRTTSLFRILENIYGVFTLADEEKFGREQICWRLVRPNESSDMGPLHADAWFWELGHGTMPRNAERVKVWVALYCEPGLNGLRVVPCSHKKEWKYHGEYRNGFMKPQIDEDENQLQAELIHTQPGDAIVFHDRLLHGGAPNKGKCTRVSLEFTMLIKK